MKAYWDENGVTLYNGDALAVLRDLPDQSVNCCVTSPPYWGLRDYGHAGQLGLETTPAEYVAKMVDVFREVRRVLRDDGTLWLNLGDSYAGAPVGSFNGGGFKDSSAIAGTRDMSGVATSGQMNKLVSSGCKAKDLIGIPWSVAFALRNDGWYLRSDIIWHKPNPMPESVTDRPTKAHEYLFLLSKSERYHYDHEAIKEPGSGLSGGAAFGKVNLDGPGARRISAEDNARIRGSDKQRGHSRRHAGFNDRWDAMEKAEQVSGRVNKRDVWTICPANYAEAHFATFPPKLIEPCIRAGCPNGGTVLDPFFGAGTTGLVAQQQHVRCIGIELNQAYCDIAMKRLSQGVLFGSA